MRWDRVGAILSAHVVFLGIQPCRCNRARPRPYCYSIQIHEGFDEEISFWSASADSGDLKVKNINFLNVAATGEQIPLAPIERCPCLNLELLEPLKPGVLRHADLYSSKTRGAYSLLLWVLNMRFMRNLPLLRFSIWYIATLLDHCDVEDQRTVTGNYAQKSWVFKTNPKPLRTFQHYRLVLQEIGLSLTVFNDFREMLVAMRSALQGKCFQLARWFFTDVYCSASGVVLQWACPSSWY